MRLVSFNLTERAASQEIWVNPDHVVALEEGGKYHTRIYLTRNVPPDKPSLTVFCNLANAVKALTGGG